MPIYEYKCEETNNIYEVEQRINSEAFTKCVMPGCPCNGQSATHRLISKNVGVIFNGNGFYQTDYARKPEPAQQPASAPCCSCADSSCPHAK